MKFGTWCIIPSIQIASVLAQKLDFIIIDREHGNASYEDVLAMCSVVQREKKLCYARPSSNNEAEILHLLDSGVDGIIIPHVSTVEDVKKFIDYTTFPPSGNRGYTPFVYAGKYGIEGMHSKLYRCSVDASLMRGIIIEDMEGVKNLPNILKYPIDMVYIGIYDLASSLGIDIIDSKIQTICTTISKIVTMYDKHISAIFSDKNSLQAIEHLGIQHAVYKTDTAIINDSIGDMLTW